jgi:phenylacetate-coenzyme A ligase PaaK-like adenylate-forming protein
VRYAQASSAFYRDLYHHIDLGSELSPAQLPVINKRRLMENFDAVVTDPRLRRADLEQHLKRSKGDERYLDRYRVVATAGTSGLRGIFAYDRPAWRIVLANTIRWRRLIGISPTLPTRMRICSIGADNPMHMTSRIPMSLDVGLFRLLHIEASDPLPQQIATLNAFQPDALLPYPSVAALLAREQLAGRLSIHPKVVATHSELLTPEMAKLIEDAWKTKPFNHYGLTEEPHVGTDCPEHTGIHLFEDTVMIEVVDDDYRPVPDGEMGTRYLLTNLYNRSQPLIRYEVTDMLCRSPEHCPCGRPYALVQSMGGRAEDVLRLRRKDGNGKVAITPMIIGLAIESFVGIREYAAEHDGEGIRVHLVVPSENEKQRIATKLPERLREDLERQGAVPPPIALAFVDMLERSAQRMGKINIVGRRRHPAGPAP